MLRNLRRYCKGLLTPGKELCRTPSLLVRELEERKYEVVARARRLRAAKLAELENLPVRIVKLTVLPTSRPLDQSSPCECPPLDVALTAIVSATDSVPQKDDAVAEPVLVDQFQLQPYTIREEPLSGADDRRTDDHLKLVHKTSAVFLSLFQITKRNTS
jgi:hypothetical protein